MIHFYPGCTLSSSAKPYRRSLEWVFRRLGLEIEELPGWTCCGATSAHATNRDLAYALPACNLALAQKQGSDLMVACSACYHRLKATQLALDSSDNRERLEQLIEKKLDGRVQVQNVLEILSAEPTRKRIDQERTKALAGVRLVSYYGCLLPRIPRVPGFDSIENPSSMDRLVAAAGATAIDWPAKTACCGASLSVINEAISLQMCGRILEMARRVGAEMIVTSCPFCQYNLDWAQWVGAGLRACPGPPRGFAPTVIPVIFITQLLGLALGGSDKDLMLEGNLTGAEKIVCHVGARHAVPLHS